MYYLSTAFGHTHKVGNDTHRSDISAGACALDKQRTLVAIRCESDNVVRTAKRRSEWVVSWVLFETGLDDLLFDIDEADIA